MPSQATIQKIADFHSETLRERIADRFNPEEIILFGSYARGEAHPHSDLTLLIVTKTRAPLGQRSAPIIKMLAQDYAEPIDVVVRSAQTIKEWQQVPGSFAHQVLTEGIVLYNRQKQPA
ncbi:MAG: nucleotidyltransferase domain-containing protein [Kaiparowitsia implicata GSE-PSE-MK54-09C]|jgi:predicted nucleotidyltransferase|nr:nucleotidyltransferase domain-containing protein [Kaiparowitsia implicata GSE-PSE-MK54-09C]